MRFGYVACKTAGHEMYRHCVRGVAGSRGRVCGIARACVGWSHKPEAWQHIVLPARAWNGLYQDAADFDHCCITRACVELSGRCLSVNTKHTAGHAEIYACGDGKTSRQARPSLKQEPIRMLAKLNEKRASLT